MAPISTSTITNQGNSSNKFQNASNKPSKPKKITRGQLSRELDKAKKEISELMKIPKDNQQLKQELEKAKGELVKASEENQQFKQELEKAKGKISELMRASNDDQQLKQELEIAKRKIIEWEKKIKNEQKLEQELENAKREITELTKKPKDEQQIKQELEIENNGINGLNIKVSIRSFGSSIFDATIDKGHERNSKPETEKDNNLEDIQHINVPQKLEQMKAIQGKLEQKKPPANGHDTHISPISLTENEMVEKHKPSISSLEDHVKEIDKKCKVLLELLEEKKNQHLEFLINANTEMIRASSKTLSEDNLIIEDKRKNFLLESLTDSAHEGFNCTKFKIWLDKLLLASSYADFCQKEQNYHNLLFGSIHATFQKAKSNRESGKGRYDIMIPLDHKIIILELKVSKIEYNLPAIALTALKQIYSKRYWADSDFEGKELLNIGIAFHKKIFELAFYQNRGECPSNDQIKTYNSKSN